MGGLLNPETGFSKPLRVPPRPVSHLYFLDQTYVQHDIKWQKLPSKTFHPFRPDGVNMLEDPQK